MQAEDAARQLFPGSPPPQGRTVSSTDELRAQVRTLLGRTPTVWESAYRIFAFTGGERGPGFVILVEEIGKHRPITYAVAVGADGTVRDLVVLVYREAYGGEIRHPRFLKQYAGKTLTDPMLAYRDIRNISGATLSVEATGRAARKAIAVLKALGDLT